MAASRKERTESNRRVGERGEEQRALIPVRFQHAAAIGLLFLSLVFFFREVVFQNKTFMAEDNIASLSFETLKNDAKAEGIFPLWNPYIFCGMPAYGSLTLGGDRPFDLSGEVLRLSSSLFKLVLLNADGGNVLFYYFLLSVGMYLFAFHWFRNKVVALIVALAATYSTYIIIWVMAGHNTKIAVVAFFPFVFYCVERLRERWNLWLALALVVLLHFIFIPAHVQMIFYLYLALGVYGLFHLARAIVTKREWKGILRVAGVFAVASGIAFLMDADKYLSVLEYNPYSIRGMSPIVKSVQAGDTKTVEGGLDYDYATSWSFAPGEMMTFFVPSWYGFGVTEYQGPLSNNQPVKINTYVGPQPFTHAPQYMGLAVTVLALVGVWRSRKEPFVQYLAVTIALSLLIAFGKEFPIVYDLFYRYFPFFNKFRVPSMILVLVQLMVPLLAGYGLMSIVGQAERPLSASSQKRWKYLLGGLAAGVLLVLVGAGVVRSLYASFISPDFVGQRLGGLPPQYASEIHGFIANLVVADLAVGFGLLLAAFGALYLYIRHSISFTTASAILVVVLVVDLWRVSAKPMDLHDRQRMRGYFTAPEYVQFIQQDTTQFRVLEFVNGQPPYDNTLAYWRIQSAYGYQGAKMRWYQDMVDVVGLHNPLLRSLMNVKYVISNLPDSSEGLALVYNGPDRKVYHNRLNLPRAFFVQRYEVTDGLNILTKIGTRAFDPREVAYFVEEPNITLDPLHPNARVEVVRAGIQDLVLRTTTDGRNLLVLSEAYYPEGWRATIDGQEVPIYRVNYMFRGIVVPPGVHTVEMVFEPRGFSIGKRLSLAVNILVLGGIAFLGVRHWRSIKKLPASPAS